MKQLAQTIPGLKEVFNYKPSPTFNFQTLGDIVSGLLNIVFYLAVFLAFYWLVWGAFQYMLASGKKEELAKARLRITWALIGLIIIFLAYLIARFGAEIFTPGKGGVPF